MNRTLAALALVALLAGCTRGARVAPPPSPTPTTTGTPGSSPTPTPSPDPAAVAFATSLEGTYAGRWVNTTFGSTGPGEATVEFDDETSSVMVTFDVDGGVFGAGDPPAHTMAGVLSDRVIAFTEESDEFGTIAATIAIDGRVDATLLEVPGERVERVEATGTFTSSGLDLLYTVEFSDDSSAAGTFELDRT